MVNNDINEYIKRLAILANKSLVKYNGARLDLDFINISKACFSQGKGYVSSGYTGFICILSNLSTASKYSNLPSSKNSSLVRYMYKKALEGSEEIAKILALWCLTGIINIYDCLENVGVLVINYIDCLNDYGNGVSIENREGNKYKIELYDVTTLLLICLRLVLEGTKMEGLCAYDFIYMLEEVYLGSKLTKMLADKDYVPRDDDNIYSGAYGHVLPVASDAGIHYVPYSNHLPSNWNTEVYEKFEKAKVAFFISRLKDFADKKLLYVSPDMFNLLKKDIKGYYNEAMFLYSAFPKLFNILEIGNLLKMANSSLIFMILDLFDVNATLNSGLLEGKLYY